MQRWIGFLVCACSMLLLGCATRTSELVGGSAGLACTTHTTSPGLLPVDRPHHIAVGITGGGGRYGGVIGSVNYGMKLSNEGDLLLGAGYFRDNSISTSQGLSANVQYKMGVVKDGNGNYWITVVPEYHFLLTDYPEITPSFYHEGERLRLYHAVTHAVGVDAVLGTSTEVIGLGVHLGPYAGTYAFHATRDDQVGF